MSIGVDRVHFRYSFIVVMLLIQSCSEPMVESPNPQPPTPAPPTPTVQIQEPTVSAAFEPPPGFTQYQDSVVGVSVFVPDSWVVTEIVPGQSAILQSYPEGKYIGGELFELGDTKCDLTIRPPEIDVAGLIQQLKSDPVVTIVSEQVIVLQSGKPGTRVEVESLGRSVSLITDDSGRVVVLACFGELAPFDEIAVTLSEGE